MTGQTGYAERVMISYAELERAIARWKARMSGAPQQVEPAASGTVQTEVPVSTAPEGADGETAPEGAVGEDSFSGETAIYTGPSSDEAGK